MAENTLKYPAKLSSNNLSTYGIVNATEVSGFKQVAKITDLYAISIPILSESKTGEDAIGQDWFVQEDKHYYRLKDWAKRGTAEGWEKLPDNNDQNDFDGPVNFNGITKVLNLTDSTAPNNGAFVVIGGVGIGKNLNVGANLGVTGTTTLKGTVTINGATTINNTTKITNSTDASSPVSGAVIISGGLGVAKKIHSGSIITANSGFSTTYSSGSYLSAVKKGALQVEGAEFAGIFSSKTKSGKVALMSTVLDDILYFGFETNEEITAETDAFSKVLKWDIINQNLISAKFTGALIGNASTATKLQTPRTINGTNFDGSANITTSKWGTQRVFKIATYDGTNIGEAVNVDGSGDITIKLPQKINGNIEGNAASATKLQTPRTFKVTDNDGTNSSEGVNFDGTANVTLVLPTTIKASLNGNADTAAVLKNTRTFSIANSDGTGSGEAVSFNGSANAILKLPAAIKASLNGNADTASKFQTARNITLAGEALGQVSFDGTKDVTINVTSNLAVDKPLVGLTISPTWKYSGGTSTSNALTVEKGETVSLTATWKWVHNDSYKDPETCSGPFGTSLPSSNTPSQEYTEENIKANKTYTQVIKAKQKGYKVVDSKVVAADAEDSKSASISVTFRDRLYYGVVNSKSPSESDIKALSNELVSGRGKTISNVTCRTGEYYCYAYPESLGNLTGIIQDGATPVLSAFNLTKLKITNAHGLEINLNVYVSGNDGAFTRAKLQFS